jgi:hypothetical protein
MLLCKILIHVRTVLIHKWYVGYYCFKAGLYKQGIFHDISKFSYTEFMESIKYANGKDSPINKCKKKKMGIQKLGFIIEDEILIIMQCGLTILMMVENLSKCLLNMF